ncbi:MAG: four helix bundle protein [Phycisphaerae bacterium]|nr:four helix bundle protein [Phycisphaerae bacterium]
MAKVSKIGDLQVYRRLVELHLQVHEDSLGFPQFEMYELGSQVRRSSNSAPANLAEGFNNRHKNIYLECISRSLGEIRETQHHLMIAWRKRYMPKERYEQLVGEYNECSRMLRAIARSIQSGTPSGRQPNL